MFDRLNPCPLVQTDDGLVGIAANTIQPTHPVTSDSSRYCLGTVAPPPDIDVDPAMMTASKGAEHGAIRD